MMHALENTETVGLLRCHACSAEQPRRDKFCRQCGASQRLNLASLTVDTDRSVGETRPLLGAKHYDSCSGALLTLATASVSARAVALPANRWVRRLAGALIAVPLWLMIVLLAPLDAYIAARAIARQG